TLLLLDPATVSLNEHKRAGEVIAHELAHMWYGDLVTMAWWDDLWLNEAFATWMAYRVVDDWRPEWRLWQGFEHDRAGALALDALANTHPIYAEVRSVAEATQNFDAITYEKGAAVVRMIEHFLGPEKFRAGVRLYMRRHREGNAVAADLWRALEEASGREVARVAEAGGFYRALHDPADQSALLEDLAALTAVERLALASDQWALVRSAKAPIENFLEVADALGDETDYDVLDGLAGPLALVDEQIVEPGSVEQARFRGWIPRRFGPALTRLGWRPAADEDG